MRLIGLPTGSGRIFRMKEMKVEQKCYDQLFYDTNLVLFESLRENIRQAEYTCARKQIHSAKGAALLIGASDIVDIFSHIDAALRNNMGSHAMRLMDAASDALDRYNTRLNRPGNPNTN